MLDHSPSGLFGIVSTVKRGLDKLVSWFCISLIALMTLLVTYQVIVRYVFNDPSAVSEVLSRYLFIWLVLFGSAYVFGMKEHMAILFIKEKFSPKAQIIVEAFTELAIVVFALSIMIFGGYSSATRQMWQLDSALQIPMGTIYAAIPISGALMVFYFIHNELQLVERWKQLRSSAE